MKNFDQFDESIKRKMDGMNFQFNEANWEKMSQVLDASRPSKKPFGKLPLISSIVVGSALIVGSVWFMISAPSNSNEVAQNTQAVVVNANSNVNEANAISNNNSVNSNKVAGDLSLNNSTNPNTSESNDVEIVTNSNNSIASSNSNVAVNTVNSEKKFEANKISTKKDVVTTKDPDNDKVIAALSNANDAEVVKDDTQMPIGSEEGAHFKNAGNVDVAMTRSDNKTDVRSSSDQVVENNNNQTPEEKNINADPSETEIVALPTLTTTLGQTADEIAAANLITATVEEKKAWEYVRVKHHTVSLEGGAINSFGWRVNQTRNGNNISPVLGVNYMYNFDSRSSLLVGLQYNSIANLGEAKANFSVTSYGFGVNNDVTTYKLMDLHYAVMPIKFIHRINKNNAVGFGFNMMYLMNTRTEITRTMVVESNVSTISEKYYEMGYGFNQLNSFNSQIALSYHHSISNRLALNAEINKSLMNVVKDYKYFDAKNANSAPASIKLSLTYTLFNK